MRSRHRVPPGDLVVMAARQQQRKFDDIALADRVMRADRAALVTECDALGLSHEGRSDDELRRGVLRYLRNLSEQGRGTAF